MDTTKYVVCRTHKSSEEVSFLSYSSASERKFFPDLNAAKDYSLESAYNLILTYAPDDYIYSIGITQTRVEYISPERALVRILDAKLAEEVKSSKAKIEALTERISQAHLELKPLMQEPAEEYVMEGTTYELVPEVLGCVGCAFHYPSEATSCDLPIFFRHKALCTGKIFKIKESK